MNLDDTDSILLPHSSIMDLLNSPNSKIEDVLIDNITFRLFNTGNTQLIRYFCDHVKDLLRLAFKLTDPSSPNRNNKNKDIKGAEISEQALWRYEQMSSRSFAILEHSDPTLTEAMLSNDQLRDIASSILWENNPESVLLSRLSSLTLVAFLYNPSIAQSSCGYVLQMLNYVSEPSILSLFEIVCSSEDRNVVLQQWLLSLSFPDILYKEIENIQLNLTKSFDKNSHNKSSPSTSLNSSDDNLFSEINHLMQKSQKANQYCGLLKIVTFCSKSLVLSQSVRTHRFVELLNQDLGTLPQFIEDIRWESISSMYCNQTSELLRGFFNPAINILQDSKLCITLSGISAIKLLTTMAQNDHVLRPFMSIAEVTKIIIKLMIEHPDHSFLHMAARDYLQASFMHPKTRKNAIHDSIPAVLEASLILSESIELSEESNDENATDIFESKTEDEKETTHEYSSLSIFELNTSENSTSNSFENNLSKFPANSSPSSPARKFGRSQLNSPSSSAPGSPIRNSNFANNSSLCSLSKESNSDTEFNIPVVTEFNASLRASLFSILNMAVNMGKTDQKTMSELKKIPGLVEFATTKLAEYNLNSNKFYGGSAPPPQICNAKDMANDSVFRMRGF